MQPFPTKTESCFDTTRVGALHVRLDEIEDTLVNTGILLRKTKRAKQEANMEARHMLLGRATLYIHATSGATLYIRGTTSMMVNEASPVATSSVLPVGFKYVNGCKRARGEECGACERVREQRRHC